VTVRSSLVGVVHQPGLGSSAIERHLQGIDDELGAGVRS
jgi:hypothetical protein